jgi:hypothetical protein
VIRHSSDHRHHNCHTGSENLAGRLRRKSKRPEVLQQFQKVPLLRPAWRRGLGQRSKLRNCAGNSRVTPPGTSPYVTLYATPRQPSGQSIFFVSRSLSPIPRCGATPLISAPQCAGETTLLEARLHSRKAPASLGDSRKFGKNLGRMVEGCEHAVVPKLEIRRTLRNHFSIMSGLTRT